MEPEPNKDSLMSKSWKCGNCNSFNIRNLVQVSRQGKWMVEGKCEDCETIMRFTKHGSYIYALPKKEAEKVPF